LLQFPLEEAKDEQIQGIFVDIFPQFPVAYQLIRSFLNESSIS
jgi:hypothetical protein